MALIKQSSKRASERPGLTTGGLVAAMLTAALISVFYLAWKVVGLPFVPFDAFDWMARILPGQILAAGIDVMPDLPHASPGGCTVHCCDDIPEP